MSFSDALGCLFFGAAGALIGYGHSETVAAACTGGGVGLVILPVAYIVLGVFGGGS